MLLVRRVELLFERARHLARCTDFGAVHTLRFFHRGRELSREDTPSPLLLLLYLLQFGAELGIFPLQLCRVLACEATRRKRPLVVLPRNCFEVR